MQYRLLYFVVTAVREQGQHCQNPIFICGCRICCAAVSICPKPADNSTVTVCWLTARDTWHYEILSEKLRSTILTPWLRAQTRRGYSEFHSRDEPKTLATIFVQKCGQSGFGAVPLFQIFRDASFVFGWTGGVVDRILQPPYQCQESSDLSRGPSNLKIKALISFETLVPAGQMTRSHTQKAYRCGSLWSGKPQKHSICLALSGTDTCSATGHNSCWTQHCDAA
jgi:hypothetical protein